MQKTSSSARELLQYKSSHKKRHSAKQSTHKARRTPKLQSNRSKPNKLSSKRNSRSSTKHSSRHSKPNKRSGKHSKHNKRSSKPSSRRTSKPQTRRNYKQAKRAFKAGAKKDEEESSEFSSDTDFTYAPPPVPMRPVPVAPKVKRLPNLKVSTTASTPESQILSGASTPESQILSGASTPESRVVSGASTPSKPCNYMMKKVPDDGPLFSLRDVQLSASKRFASRCGQQRGFLVMHTMGSGKTVIGLAYMANFSNKYKKTIIVPEGLDTPWRKDMKDFSLTADFQCEVQFITYKDLQTMTLLQLEGYLKDAIVVCDEAHILVRVLRGSNRANVRRALKNVKRVLLLTGTPLQSGWGDLGVLINVCHGDRVMPGTHKAFDAKFQQVNSLPANEKRSWMVWDNVASIAKSWTSAALSATSSAATAVTLYLANSNTTDIGQSFANTTDGNATMSDISTGINGTADFAEPVTGDASARSVALVTTIGFITGVVLWGCVSAFIRQTHDQKVQQLMSLDVNRVAEEVKNYVSFFDYNFAPSDAPELHDYPAIFQSQEIRTAIPLTPFQQTQLEKNTRSLFDSSLAELELYADVDLDYVDGGADYAADWTDASTQESWDVNAFRLRMRALGNLDASGLTYTPVRMPKSKAVPGKQAKLEMYGNRAFQSKLRGSADKHMAKSMRDGMAKYVFGCPKFDKIHELCLEARVKHHFLPVVYSNFEKNGVELLSAYMTARNLPHIVIHPGDSQDVRERLVAIANLPHRKYTVHNGVVKVLDSTYDKQQHANLMGITSNEAVSQNDSVDSPHTKELVRVSENAIKQVGGAALAKAEVNFYAAAEKFAQARAAEALDRVRLGSIPTFDDAMQLWKPRTSAWAKNNDVLCVKELMKKEAEASRKGVYGYEELVHNIITNDTEHDENIKSTKQLECMLDLIKSFNNAMLASTELNNRAWDPLHDEAPFCVLLHPDIREGIGFDLSPMMVCVEVPDGLGNRDQIYARVLRSVNKLKRTLAFIDGTFLWGEDSIPSKQLKEERAAQLKKHKTEAKVSVEWKKSSKRPWRVTKKIVQLMTGIGPYLWETPSMLRSSFPSLPKYFTLPDVFVWYYGEHATVKRPANKVMVGSATAVEAAFQQAKQEAEGGVKHLVDITLFSQDEQRLKLLPYSEHKVSGMSEAESLRQFGELSYWWTIRNLNRQLHFISAVKVAGCFWGILAPQALQQLPAYRRAVSEGRFAFGFDRYLEGVQHASSQTADMQTMELNLKAKEKYDEMLKVFSTSVKDDVAACVTNSKQVEGCNVWTPRETKADQDQAANQDTSCIKKHDLVD